MTYYTSFYMIGTSATKELILKKKKKQQRKFMLPPSAFVNFPLLL